MLVRWHHDISWMEFIMCRRALPPESRDSIWVSSEKEHETIRTTGQTAKYFVCVETRNTLCVLVCLSSGLRLSVHYLQGSTRHTWVVSVLKQNDRHDEKTTTKNTAYIVIIRSRSLQIAETN